MKKILVVQSRSSPERIEGERANFGAAVGAYAAVEFLSALDEKLAWSSPDEILKDFGGVIFGGSSDFDFSGGRDENDPARIVSFIILSRVRNMISHALRDGLPLLGVCFGHQIIAEMRRGEVRNDPEQGKVGSYELALTEEGKKDKLFGGFPQKFFAQYDHKDSVTKLPEGATVLASGDRCRFSALRYHDAAYTVQFHPEVEKLRYRGEYDYRESPYASSVISLWIEKIVR